MTASANGASVNFEAIQTLVNQGKTVISAEDSAIIELAWKTAEEGKTATFYLKDVLFTEIMRRRLGASERETAIHLKPLSPEEAARIKADFNIEIDGFSSKETCPRCGSVYGMYEFIQQGIKEHGEETVRTVFSLKGASLLQIHPRQDITCQTCALRLSVAVGSHSYIYRSANHSYGCCR